MKNCKIVHLDDHKLITYGIEKLLEKIIPGCEYISFTDPADALNYMKNSIEQAATVGLLIIDFINSGPNGYNFAKTIRQFELRQKPSNPHTSLNYVIRYYTDYSERIKTKIFSNYLPLTMPGLELTNFFKMVFCR